MVEGTRIATGALLGSHVNARAGCTRRSCPRTAIRHWAKNPAQKTTPSTAAPMPPIRYTPCQNRADLASAPGPALSGPRSRRSYCPAAFDASPARKTISRQAPSEKTTAPAPVDMKSDRGSPAIGGACPRGHADRCNHPDHPQKQSATGPA